MTLEQLRVFKILMNQRKQQIVSTIDDRELLRRVTFNEGIRRTISDLEDFISGKIDENFIKRVLEMEENNG